MPPPVIVVGPANQTIAVSSLALLPCKATADKPVRISWLKDQKPVPTAHHRFTLLTSGALQIQGVCL